jgi:hypothetical protein
VRDNGPGHVMAPYGVRRIPDVAASRIPRQFSCAPLIRFMGMLVK